MRRRIGSMIVVLVATLFISALAIAQGQGQGQGQGGLPALFDHPWTQFGTDVYYDGGNVGIGTTSPGAKLHVTTTGINTVGMQVKGTDNSQWTGWSIFGGDTAVAVLGQYNTNHVYIGAHTAALNAWYPVSINPGANVYLAEFSGNVGIGTTGPGAKLEVAGQVKITGGTPGLGKVLTSDVSGLATWEAAVTGGDPSYGSSASSPNDAVFVNDSGNVGIGTTSFAIPDKVLQISDSATPYIIVEDTTTPTWVALAANDSAGFVGTFTNSSLHLRTGWHDRVTIDTSGNVTGTYGNYHVSSDVRNKTDIVTITSALEKVLKLRGVNFRWKDGSGDNTLQMGLIAQEVEKVVPEVVHTADDEMRTKAVEYQYMVGLLVEAIKELKANNQAFKRDNIALKSGNDQLKNEVKQLKDGLLALSSQHDAIESMLLAGTTITKEKLVKYDNAGLDEAQKTIQ